MQNLLTLENIVSTPIEEGDAGIILKRDGTFRVFTTGEIEAAKLTDTQLNQGMKLQALALALAVPQMMNVLMQMAQDTDIVGESGINTGRKH